MVHKYPESADFANEDAPSFEAESEMRARDRHRSHSFRPARAPAASWVTGITLDIADGQIII
jgi:hypothetical protein